MPKFTQKWAIVSMLSSIEEGAQFRADEFPLHVTLAGVFASDYDGPTLAEMLADELRDQRPIAVKVGPEVRLGPHGETPAMSIEKAPELMDLHNKLHKLLVASGAVFNDPQYQAENYLPHSTVLRGVKLPEGDELTLLSASLIDLFPDGDGRQRKIIKTFEFEP